MNKKTACADTSGEFPRTQCVGCPRPVMCSDCPFNVKDVRKPIESSKNNLYNTDKFSAVSVKKEGTTLNNRMTKSLFDTLYEETMGNPADLGAETGHEQEANDLDALEIGDDEDGDEDMVTIRVPRHVAEALCAACSAELEGGEDEGLSDEELGAEDLGADVGEDEGHEDHESGKNPFGETVEVKPAPKPLGKGAGKSLQGKPNKVGNIKPAGKANATAKLDTQAEPKPLGNKGDSLMKPGSQKVQGSKLTPGKSIFD